MQIGKQIKIFEDGQKAPKVLTQAQQNKLLQMPTVIKQQDERLMYQDDNRRYSVNFLQKASSADQLDDEEDESEEQQEIQQPIVKKK
ncbi:MAG: hypothetical protein EZS28_042840, partial [Streblomastix strix]